MEAGVPAVHAGLVAVAEPPHGTVTTEPVPFAVTMNVPDPVGKVPQVSVIFTPPEAAAAAVSGVPMASTAAMSEISPSFSSGIGLSAPQG